MLTIILVSVQAMLLWRLRFLLSNSERLLEIIEELDQLVAELKVDGQDGYAQLIRVSAEDLMWLYKDMTEYES